MKLRSTLLALCVACTTRGEGAPAPRPLQKPTSGPVARKAAPPAPTQVAAVTLPQIATSAQIAGEAQEAPWSLTATDGSGLLVTRVEAKAVLQGPLAFTELHLYFENTENRIREGTFSITLPSGAAVSRFAMQNGDTWMEAEVVEKQLARRAYEDFLHRRQDPALLEKAAGNQFSARVFPIAAKAQKHLVISFSQELPGARYVLPLRGLPKVERVDVSLDATGVDGVRAMQTLSKRNWKPDVDFVSGAATSAEALTAGTYVVAQISAFDQAQVARDTPAAMTLLVDTSASRALGFERYARTIRDLVGTLAKSYGGAMPIEVLAFDQDTQAIYRGAASGFGDAQVATMIARGAAGASDLGQALATMRTPSARVVVVTDGVLTAGASGAALVTQTKQLATSKVERIDIVLAGGIRDEHLATSLVQAGLPRTGAVLDLDAGLADVASGLGERVLTDVAVDVPGATWVYPRTIKSARPGQRTMIYARLGAPAKTIDVSIAGKRRSVGLASGTPALVERAAATAQIAELEDRLGTAKAEQIKPLRAEIAKRSVSARVISSQTSLLVLESDADYARYGIDRRALGDILVVGANGLEQTKRAAQLAIAQPTTTTTTKTPVSKNKLEESKPAKKRVAADDDGESFEGEMDKADMADAKESMNLEEESPSDQRMVATGAAAPSPEPAPPPPAPMRSDNRPRPASVTTPSPDARARTQRESRSEVRGGEAGGVVGGSVGGVALEQSRDRAEQWPPPGAPAPLKGKLAEIDRALRSRNIEGALAKARAWHHKEPGDVLALIGLGEALEAKRDFATASRIYGSIIDLFPGRADLRRFAGERLERIGAGSRTLAIDTYKRAVEERPDHLTGHRLLAYALLRDGKLAEAFTAILAGLDQKYPDGRFEAGRRVLEDDAGLIGAAYLAKFPAKRAEITAQLAQRGSSLPTQASTRFIMYWETDANDVDFHIQDAKGGHAFFSNKTLPSGGELYADITTGYGPECFAIQGTPKAGPYRLSINYYSQGPMGYGMGLLQIVKHDGKGTLTFQDRPYVIMADHAYVDLGTYQ